MVDDLLQPSRAASPLDQYRGAEAFGEDLTWAAWYSAQEAPDDKLQPDTSACARQVRWLADVAALQTARRDAAGWARGCGTPVAGGDNDHVLALGDAVHHQAGRDQ